MLFCFTVHRMLISIITVTLNADQFLQDCLSSVESQTWGEVEHIIVDGGSTDATLSMIGAFESTKIKLLSESDRGIYDALNKGISLARGDIVGVLNADDFFADAEVLEKVAAEFEAGETDIVYGDLWYVHRLAPGHITRRWISGKFNPRSLQFGWMPPHPAFYVRKSVFAVCGNYDLQYHTAADYELMLRFLRQKQIRVSYLNKVLVHMRVGGVSNRSFKNRIRASLNDYKAMRLHGIRWPWLMVCLKIFRKLGQYV